jgi:hypothetical protein
MRSFLYRSQRTFIFQVRTFCYDSPDTNGEPVCLLRIYEPNLEIFMTYPMVQTGPWEWQASSSLFTIIKHLRYDTWRAEAREREHQVL